MKQENPLTLSGLNWYGWINPKSGYGIVNLEYSTALERLTGFVSCGWERKEDVLETDYNNLTEEQKRCIDKPYKKEKVGVIKTTPQLFFNNTSEFRIGYTMVENTKIGATWTRLCNEMDAILVPSQYLVDVFKESGVVKPIAVVKQGIDSRKFAAVTNRKKSPFVFGMIGHIDDRKNWEAIVVAFCSEFEDDEPVELWIKNTNPYFAHTNFNDKRIKVINTHYKYKEVIKLYSLINCYLSPSHAEGSGLTPREAMSTGCPTILTNWSGLSEVCNPEFNYPLTPISITHKDFRGEEQPGFQADIDVRELMFYMRHVYNNYDEALKKGEKASKFIHKNFNWDTCAKDLLNKVEGLYYGSIHSK